MVGVSNTNRGKIYFFLLYKTSIMAVASAQPTIQRVPAIFPVGTVMGMQLMPRLRMTATVTLLSVCAFMALAETNLTFLTLSLSTFVHKNLVTL
jgi:hypothetical protein